MTSSKTPWPERIWRSQYGLDVARGDVAESRPISTFGEYVSSGPMNEQPVWETTMGSTFVVPNRVQLSVVSTSAADTGQIVLHYLDGDLNEQTEVITLTGLTPGLTQAADVRAVLSAYHRGGPPAGDVTMTSGGVTYGKIGVGSVQLDTSFFRVPAGKIFVVHSLYAGAVSGTSAARVVIKIQTTRVLLDSYADEGILYPLAAVGVQDTSVTLGLPHPLAVPSGEWIGLTATSNKAADVTAGLFGWIEPIRG